MSEAPLDPRFVRKLSLLCCHCVRNIAYYRMGFVTEDGTGNLKHASQFGATVNSNMLDIAVLEWCKLGDIIAVRAGQDCADGNAIGIDKDMVLGTWSRAIRGVRASFSPAPTARTDDESTTAREKSSSPASRNLASKSSCKRVHTPAFCQSRRRRQQVEPEPNPNLVDRSRQRMPVLSTNRMPLSAARFETGSRPGYFLRRGFGAGSNGSISAHSSSSTIGALILGSSCSDDQG
jgi:hypothetical protein